LGFAQEINNDAGKTHQYMGLGLGRRGSHAGNRRRNDWRGGEPFRQKRHKDQAKPS
jgi:hypothetical protein